MVYSCADSLWFRVFEKYAGYVNLIPFARGGHLPMPVILFSRAFIELR